VPIQVDQVTKYILQCLHWQIFYLLISYLLVVHLKWQEDIPSQKNQHFIIQISKMKEFYIISKVAMAGIAV
jgi:hypothetical protein